MLKLQSVSLCTSRREKTCLQWKVHVCVNMCVSICFNMYDYNCDVNLLVSQMEPTFAMLSVAINVVLIKYGLMLVKQS